jgi:hypothetical protein
MAVCGTGGWTGPLPGDPDNNSILSAVPVFGGIEVSYTYPTINPHAVAYAKLYRGITPVFAQAVHSVVMHGNTYYDKIDSGVQYWYWIQIISVNGTPGDVLGPATAVARPLIGDLITQLTGAIDSGVLSAALKSDIDKITLNYNELVGRLTDLSGDDAALSAALALVQQGVADALAMVISETTARQNGQSALVAQVDAIAALNEDTAAAVITEREARVSQYEALAYQLDQLVVGGSDGLQAALVLKALAKVVGGDALVQQISTGQISLNDQIAAVETASTVNLETIGETVTEIGALHTVKVKVNGLVGGFGVYNDGTEVQAGFDVDNFWVGRTGPDKKKPFMVKDGEVFIDEAAIDSLTIGKLRDESGRVVVENGSLAIRNAAGQIIFSAGTPLDWDYVSGSGKPENGATRNAYRGVWTYPENYLKGDTVIDGGCGWTCTVSHQSSLSARPPIYPVQSNTYWAMTVAKGEDGVDLSVKIESTNGTVFRVGQGRSTTLIARVFRNGVDVTDSISETKFRWIRVSLDAQLPPNDDATWNSLYAQGYKQILVGVDDVYAKATFHCQIIE